MYDVLSIQRESSYGTKILLAGDIYRYTVKTLVFSCIIFASSFIAANKVILYDMEKAYLTANNIVRFRSAFAICTSRIISSA